MIAEEELRQVEISGQIDVTETFISKKKILFSETDFGSAMQLPAGLKLSSPGAREWFQQRKEHLKPWLTFVSTSKFIVPQTPQKWTKRVTKNLDYFQSNYMFVFIGLIIYCLLTSPLLLLAVAASYGACYIISLRNAEKKIIISGREVTLAQQYAAVAVLSIPLFYIAGATTAIFWVIGASFFVIMLHASLYDVESIIGSDDQPFDLQMEEV